MAATIVCSNFGGFRCSPPLGIGCSSRIKVQERLFIIKSPNFYLPSKDKVLTSFLIISICSIGSL